jgi:hypothetical protein
LRTASIRVIDAQFRKLPLHCPVQYFVAEIEAGSNRFLDVL